MTETFSFVWPLGPKDVKITGDFDNWATDCSLRHGKEQFERTLPIQFDSNGKFLFKFIVDGKWITSGLYPIERDSSGNDNNFITGYEMIKQAERLELNKESKILNESEVVNEEIINELQVTPSDDELPKEMSESDREEIKKDLKKQEEEKLEFKEKEPEEKPIPGSVVDFVSSFSEKSNSTEDKEVESSADGNELSKTSDLEDVDKIETSPSTLPGTADFIEKKIENKNATSEDIEAKNIIPVEEMQPTSSHIEEATQFTPEIDNDEIQPSTSNFDEETDLSRDITPANKDDIERVASILGGKTSQNTTKSVKPTERASPLNDEHEEISTNKGNETLSNNGGEHVATTAAIPILVGSNLAADKVSKLKHESAPDSGIIEPVNSTANGNSIDNSNGIIETNNPMPTDEIKGISSEEKIPREQTDESQIISPPAIVDTFTTPIENEPIEQAVKDSEHIPVLMNKSVTEPVVNEPIEKLVENSKENAANTVDNVYEISPIKGTEPVPTSQEVSPLESKEPAPTSQEVTPIESREAGHISKGVSSVVCTGSIPGKDVDTSNKRKLKIKKKIRRNKSTGEKEVVALEIHELDENNNVIAIYDSMEEAERMVKKEDDGNEAEPEAEIMEQQEKETLQHSGSRLYEIESVNSVENEKSDLLSGQKNIESPTVEDPIEQDHSSAEEVEIPTITEERTPSDVQKQKAVEKPEKEKGGIVSGMKEARVENPVISDDVKPVVKKVVEIAGEPVTKSTKENGKDDNVVKGGEKVRETSKKAEVEDIKSSGEEIQGGKKLSKKTTKESKASASKLAKDGKKTDAKPKAEAIPTPTKPASGQQPAKKKGGFFSKLKQAFF